MPDPAAAEIDLVVADASWNWTERLFSPLANLGPEVFLLKACDWRTAINQRRPIADWLSSRRPLRPGLTEQHFILPPGWMKTYPRWGMTPLRAAIERWRRARSSTRPLVLAISYPHYLHLADQIRPDGLIYYNMDDYTLYWPNRRRAVRRLERAAVERADLSVFCAHSRSEELRRDLPLATGRILHLPHGAPGEAIAEQPCERPADAPPDLARLPRPYLGFVGSLEDRLDWPLIDALARSQPRASIVLLGREPTPRADSWFRDYQRVRSRANVHILGWKPQDQIARYMAAFDVCLIPYDIQHQFNHASCPTKIMDYMASTRPVVTTALPECRLHHRLFEVAENSESFLAAVAEILSHDSNDGRAMARWATARRWTWDHAAHTLLGQFLDRASFDRPDHANAVATGPSQRSS